MGQTHTCLRPLRVLLSLLGALDTSLVPSITLVGSLYKRHKDLLGEVSPDYPHFKLPASLQHSLACSCCILLHSTHYPLTPCEFSSVHTSPECKLCTGRGLSWSGSALLVPCTEAGRCQVTVILHKGMKVPIETGLCSYQQYLTCPGLALSTQSCGSTASRPLLGLGCLSSAM